MVSFGDPRIRARSTGSQSNQAAPRRPRRPAKSRDAPPRMDRRNGKARAKPGLRAKAARLYSTVRSRSPSIVVIVIMVMIYSSKRRR